MHRNEARESRPRLTLGPADAFGVLGKEQPQHGAAVRHVAPNRPGGLRQAEHRRELRFGEHRLVRQAAQGRALADEPRVALGQSRRDEVQGLAKPRGVGAKLGASVHGVERLGIDLVGGLQH